MKVLSCIVMGFLACVQSAAAEERVALIVGNSQYATVAALDNAGNDARLMSQSLEAVGFRVTLVEDATQIELKRAIAQFGRDLRNSGSDTVGLFYYAGHGVQSFGSNYLLPVDASLSDAADLDLVAFDASAVLRQMASARNKTNIVILDACRNNPFENIADLNDNGLAEMKAPTGTYLAYATAPGAVALDGSGGNSPFTSALARSITVEGLAIEQVFKDVRVSVIEQTGGAQTPWDTSSLTQDFFFKPKPNLTPDQLTEIQLWNSVRLTEDPVQILLYLRAYPGGMFEAEARQMLSTALRDEMGEDQPVPRAAAPSAPKPAPAPDIEMELMEVARASGSKADYEAYLDAYPDGIFAEMVRIEIAALEEKELAALSIVEPEPERDEPVTAQESNVPLPVFFDQPMPEGIEEILGKTIMQAAAGNPLFSPIEGLPPEAWQTKVCSDCHQWTRDDLCAQANTYVAQSETRALDKMHPYGGSFKRNLKTWAQGGCQ
ncbi:MAG: caspase family protein [Pseudomonadota bacterium]